MQRDYYMNKLDSCGFDLDKIPVDVWDKELYIKAVQKADIFRPERNPLWYAPRDIFDRQMYLMAVQAFLCNLKEVPEILRDREMCLEALKSRNKFLEEYSFDKHDIDYFYCEMDVINRWLSNNSTLEFVPENLRDLEMCLESLKCNNRNSKDYIPKELIDNEEIIKAISEIKSEEEDERITKALSRSHSDEGVLEPDVIFNNLPDN